MRLFKFIDGLGPVSLEQTGQSTVGQQLAAGLAGRAIIGFVAGVANSLDRRVAIRTWFLITAMHGHLRSKCSYFGGEMLSGLGGKFLQPIPQSTLRGVEESLHRPVVETRSERERRQPRDMQDLVRVRIGRELSAVLRY